jgi:hypothetical protein
MLDADLWSKRIGRLDEPGVAETKVTTTEAQIRQDNEDEARRILDETQTPAYQTMDVEVEEIEFDDTEVQHPTIEPPRVKPTESPRHVETQPVDTLQKEPDVVPPGPPVPTKVNNPDDEPLILGEMTRLGRSNMRKYTSRNYRVTMVMRRHPALKRKWVQIGRAECQDRKMCHPP